LEKDITPHIPVWERYERTDGMFSRLDFIYDAERDVYICPNGRFLKTTGIVYDGRVCELKGRCNAPHSERSHVISTKKRAITSARAAIAQNLKTLANHTWRPPPDMQVAYVSRECQLRQASVGSVNVIPLQPER
jgi:hypothetical protein